MAHVRTAVRAVHIRGYRSLADVALSNLPDLVVMLGANGSGKSNVLRAVHLALRAVGSPLGIAESRDLAMVYDEADAATNFELTTNDFRQHGNKEIRIGLELMLGTHAGSAIDGRPQPLGLTKLEAVFQDVGSGSFRIWFDRAECGVLHLVPSRDHKTAAIRAQMRAHEAAVQAAVGNIEQQRSALSQVGAAQQAQLRVVIKTFEGQRETSERQLAALRAQLGVEELRAERIRSFLGVGVLQASDAYRRPALLEPELFAILLSRDPARRLATKRLSQLLGRAKLFGSDAPVDLAPVEPKGVLVGRNGTDLPLENLGTGQQQILLMLAQRVITPAPISQIEEPEAHLHKNLMDPLAEVLRESVTGPDAELDQLWISTHHHLFAFADTFFDVSLGPDDATRVRQRPRAEAIEHFYEPNPYWDALKELIRDGVAGDDVLSIDDEGRSVTVADVRSSIAGDGKVANRFVTAALRSVLLSMTTAKDQ